MWNFLTYATESDLGSIFINCHCGKEIQTVIGELSHTHPETPIVTDNSAATGTVMGEAKHKRSWAIDTRLLLDSGLRQTNVFRMFWEIGESNLGND